MIRGYLFKKLTASIGEIWPATTCTQVGVKIAKKGMKRASTEMVHTAFSADVCRVTTGAARDKVAVSRTGLAVSARSSISTSSEDAIELSSNLVERTWASAGSDPVVSMAPGRLVAWEVQNKTYTVSELRGQKFVSGMGNKTSALELPACDIF